MSRSMRYYPLKSLRSIIQCKPDQKSNRVIDKIVITYTTSLLRRQNPIHVRHGALTTKVQLNRMNALYSTFIRRMGKGGYKRKGDTWSFVFSNEDLIRMAKPTDLSSYIRKQQRNYAWHIIRKENSSIVKRLFFLIVQNSGRLLFDY